MRATFTIVIIFMNGTIKNKITKINLNQNSDLVF